MKTLKFMINFWSKVEYFWRILIIYFFIPYKKWIIWLSRIKLCYVVFIKIKKLKIKKKIAKGFDRTVLVSGSCSPILVLGVHGIATYARFFMLKKLIFIPIPGFHDSTSRSDPVLRTRLNTDVHTSSFIYIFIGA